MRRSVLPALVLAAALAACGPPPASPGAVADLAGEPAVRSSWTSCAEVAPAAPEGVDATALPRLEAGFAPAAAVLCQQLPRQRPDGGTDLVAVESRATAVAELVAALRLPDEPATSGACRLDRPVVAWFALLDAQGRWVRPGVPVDGCGKPRIEVRRALAALPLTPVRTRVVRELESAQAAASGCGPSWADMVWVETRQGTARAARPPGSPLAAAGQVRLCVFRVPDGERGSGKPGGEFERGGVLPAPRWRDIAAGIQAAEPARRCSTPAGRFALLRAVDSTGGEIYVELDGCRRILLVDYAAGPPVLAQGGPSLTALLDRG